MLPPHSVLLDTALPDSENRQTLLFTDPRHVHRADQLGEVPGLLAALDAHVRAGRYVAGFLTYEAGYGWEQLPMPEASRPLGWFGVYDRPAPPEAAAALLQRTSAYRLSPPQFALDRTAYREKIARIRHHIAEGDVYQINFTAPFVFDFDGDPLALYRDLRLKQRVAYGAVVQAPEVTVLSLSPELFFRRDGRRIWTRPMKGTITRGRTLDEDAAQARRLQQDEKSRAENLMIVDLLRNDLSVVCEPGSVRVPDLFTVETYQTLLQMTSTVEGQLRENVGYAELFRALFPCGSVTGAPKIRAMQRIRELEAQPRGVYCGTIGYAGPEEKAAFSVAIRTVELRGQTGKMGSGSGVVWDSDADAEYDECLLKARFLTGLPRPFRLIETMRWDGREIPLWPLHLDRLKRSAAYFGFVLAEANLQRRLDAVCASLSEAPHRVRLTLGPEGDVELQTSPLEPTRRRPWRVTFASERADSSDPFFFHKTTRRDCYERAFAEARNAGYDEAILLNERGEVTEGTRTNVLIRHGAQLLTPPLASGLLGGVYRQHLLATTPQAREQRLYPEDLHAADALFLCNAVRGLVPAVLAG